ncbi:hypothetical protein JG688_00007819, partial [Phytophthora aleatoria]
MNVIYSVKDYVSNVFHQDSGSGAIDVVAVQQPDGSLRCSPFHVHFGKFKPEDKQQVTLEVNGQVVDGVRMELGAAGEAYFVHQVQEPVDEKDYLASPLPSPLSSIGDTEELVHNDAFATSEALEPEDEENAAEMHQDGKRNESSDRLTWGWGALPSMRPEEEADDELPSMVKSASVYFDAVDIEATAAASGNVDYYDHPSMSLCGHLLDEAETEEEMHRIFSEHIVTFDFFRANPAKILANPDLRFFVSGQISSYDADMQAYLVSRVLFPYSQHLPVGTSPHEEMENTLTKTIETRTENASKTREDLISGSSLSRSTHCHTLEPLHEVLSDDGGSTQDTASISSEPYFKKSLKPSREELLAMSLCVGMNDVAFVLRSHDSGELARVTTKLYLWPVTAKVVIAQIDGAISSSAATGSMFKRRDPAAMHPGAVEFYSKLARNGYRVVYVTCLGLSQANLLHTLLHNSAREDGEIALPMGPVLLSPDRLLAYSNEVIDAEDFKIAALGAVRSLFPREVNPFYAAFGTTQTDSVVFTQVGVFSGKVFVVDPTDGSLRHRSLMGFHESYTSLLDRMDAVFPPIYSPTTQVSISRDQQIVRPPPLDSMQYAQISASMFGNNVMEKIKRADSLSVQLERSNRFMDAMHTYEQAAKCWYKREEASGVIMDELKWLRIDYEIRCVQLVALCMCGARKTATGGDNTAFLLLKKAEELTARDGLQYCKKHVQRAAVYQNVANYYKKQKKYQAALQAAEKAVRINDKLPPSDRFPIAYFLQACLHGLLQEPAKAGFMYTACLAVAESQRPANETPQTAEVFYTLKAATLHNLAIEWANLNMPDQTRDALASAMEVGVHYLAQTHPVVVRILETYKGAVEAKHEDDTLVQDPVVEAAGAGMTAAEVSLERAASNINCSPSIPEAVAKVSIVPDTTTKPATIPETHLEAGPSTAKPAVDAEMSEVMAAVLSQVSIAPAKPVEVEPVVETAASERGESVAVDAVEVAAAVEAVVEAAISAAESTPAATETPGLQEMLTEAAMPAETVEEVAAAPAKEEPAVDAEVGEVMAAVLSQVSIAPAKPVEVEPV